MNRIFRGSSAEFCGFGVQFGHLQYLHKSGEKEFGWGWGVPVIFQVAGEFCLLLYIARSGFSDGFGGKICR